MILKLASKMSKIYKSKLSLSQKKKKRTQIYEKFCPSFEQQKC